MSAPRGAWKPTRHAVLLTTYLEQYVAHRDLAAGTVHQLRATVASFGPGAAVESLSGDTVNCWLRRLRDAGRSDSYRASRRAHLLSLWRAAAQDGLAPPCPGREIIRPRPPDRVVAAWTPQEAARLLQAANRLEGHYRHGIARRAFWASYVMTAWDTGLRGCDLRRIRWDWLSPAGRIVLAQQKTGRRIVCQVRPETVHAIRKIREPLRPLIWPLWASLEMWRRDAASLVRSAGLTGSIGRLRHASGTAVEVEHPGWGHAHLGNSRTVFEWYYLDLSQVAHSTPLPPPLIYARSSKSIPKNLDVLE